MSCHKRKHKPEHDHCKPRRKKHHHKHDPCHDHKPPRRPRGPFPAPPVPGGGGGGPRR